MIYTVHNCIILITLNVNITEIYLVIMSGSLICKSNFSVTMLFWWARSRTGTDWSTPRGWCWWTYSMTGAAPAPVWRLISRSSGSSPSWPRTGWCWPELAVITSRSWRHLGGIQDQLGQCSLGFNWHLYKKNLIPFYIQAISVKWNTNSSAEGCQ